MLGRTRVATTPDMARIAGAVSRPGIDPREWVSLAVVNAITVDPSHGPILDVTLMPSGAPEHARLGAAYAGNGFGFYTPVEVGDEVVVAAPGGEPDSGLVVVARVWSGGDPPPAGAAAHPADVLLLAKAGATVRVQVAGAGNVVLEPTGSGKVLLGGESGTAAVALQGAKIEITPADILAAGLVAGATPVTLGPGITSLKGTITTGCAAKAEAK